MWEDDRDCKTQLDLIMDAFDFILERHQHGSFRSLWEQLWSKLDGILHPLLPWEWALQYCTLSPEVSTVQKSTLLQLREVRHGVRLRQIGYALDVDFLDVIRDRLPKPRSYCVKWGRLTKWMKAMIEGKHSKLSAAYNGLLASMTELKSTTILRTLRAVMDTRDDVKATHATLEQTSAMQMIKLPSLPWP
jgi:hypothetical protein